MKRFLSILTDYILLTLGTLIMAAALVIFLEPYTIAPGGVTGLAIVIRKIAGVPIDVTNLVINIPLFIAGLIILGKKFGFKTAYATFTLSGFIRLFYTFIEVKMLYLDDLLLAAIYGGVVMGLGIGLVFRTGGTTGGSDLAGAILHKYFPHLSIAKLMMIIDLIIVIAAGIVDKKFETALYSIISLYILVKIADFIVEGLNYAKEFIIISDKYQEIGEAIIKKMDRSATILKSQGLYSGNEKNILLCIVSRSEVATLKKVIQDVDEYAFVRVNSVHEVLGEGFTWEPKKS
ncbi:MAG: YitT family protein [Clostridiales bacterium]|nr:YitT family protein [Clostridiales bacterium]